jgi:nitric oxide reductase subunit C
VACHTVSGLSTGIVGPNLDGIGSRAADSVAGLSAEEYLRQSIIDPNFSMVDDFAEGIMPQTFGDSLSEDQIDSLIAFMLTLE